MMMRKTRELAASQAELSMLKSKAADLQAIVSRNEEALDSTFAKAER